MKKGIIKNSLKNLATIVVTASLTLGGGIALTYRGFDEDLLNNKKYMDKVEEELGANMKIMNLHNDKNEKLQNPNKITRLAPNSSKKIYINIGDEISEQTKGNIRQVIDEMNEVFDVINDKYNFTECDNESFKKYKAKEKTTISFNYKQLDDDLSGEERSREQKRHSLWSDDEEVYIVGSSIYLNEQDFVDMPNESQLFIIKHEFLHALGFADIYGNYSDETSVMNVGMTGVSHLTSPNDLRMLYVAYGDKHLNMFGFYDQEKMDKVKKIMDDYEFKYYEYLINKVKEKTGKTFQKITSEDLKERGFKKERIVQKYEDGRYKYEDLIFIIKGDKYEYYDADGNYQVKDLIIGDDYVILPNVWYTKQQAEEVVVDDFLVLLKDENGLNLYDVSWIQKLEDGTLDVSHGQIEFYLR